MKLRLILTPFAFALLAISSANAQHAPATVCEEKSSWLSSMPSESRDWVLLKVSSNAANKFFEVISAPGAKPDDELWGYKILSISHYILSKSPHASPATRTELGKVEYVTTGIIRGRIDFDTFKQQLSSSDKSISALMGKAEGRNPLIYEQNKRNVDSYSTCVIVEAMRAALPDQKSK